MVLCEGIRIGSRLLRQIEKIFNRYQRSFLNRPLRTYSSRLRLVAAIMRTSTLTVREAPPLELIILDHSEQFGPQFQGQSADLIQKRVAPSAVSKRPNRLSKAPVKALFSYPASRSLGIKNQMFLETPSLTRISSIKHHFVNADCKRLRPTNAVKRCQ
jgi:hypothetical protein